MLIITAVGEFGLKDTSIQVTGLRPGHCYNIRVIATNASNFSTLGPLIRLRTLPPPEEDGTDSTKSGENDAEEWAQEFEPAAIRAGPSQFGPAANTINLQAAREATASNTGGRRVLSGRRLSPAMPVADPPSLLSSRATSVDEDDSDEAIQRLIEELNRLRHDQHEVDRQLEDEDREHLTAVAELSRDRDHLKQVLKEKEESTADLRKHGGYLEKMNRSAQGRKAAKEKILQQKKADRQKIKDDIDRWGKDIDSMRQEVGRAVSEQETITAAKDANVSRIRQIIAKDHNLIKDLEDEIRMRGIQIKSMEKGQEHLDGNDEDVDNTANAEPSAERILHVRTPPSIQAQLVAAYQFLQQVNCPAFSPLIVKEYSRESGRGRQSACTGTPQLLGFSTLQRSKPLRSCFSFRLFLSQSTCPASAATSSGIHHECHLIAICQPYRWTRSRPIQSCTHIGLSLLCFAIL